jgi:predicted CopG family antitoxin
MARVAVADDVWADFRAAAGHRSVSQVLGELVEREVKAYRSRRLKEGAVDDRELVKALERARLQQEELAVIVERLEALRHS